MLRKSCFVLLVIFLGFSSTVFADQITLKNGDHLSGKIVKVDGKTLVLHTEFAGDVELQLAAITQISTDAPVLVALSNGQTVVGHLRTTDGKIEVQTSKGAPVEVAMEHVVAIQNDAGGDAVDKYMHPGLLRGWNGGASVGFSLTRGNSQTENLSIAFNAARATRTDKLSLYTTAVYGTNQLATPSTTANIEEGGIRYDHNLRPLLFAFVAADFMSDALQDLNLRSVGTLGLGFHAIKSDSTTLDFLGGVNFTDENYSETVTDITVTPPITFTRKVVHNYGAFTLGEELTHKWGKNTILAQKLYFFPNLTQTGEYRGTFSLSLITKISKWLGWQNQFNDIYVSNPPPGARKNDVILTTGLNIAFTH